MMQKNKSILPPHTSKGETFMQQFLAALEEAAKTVDKTAKKAGVTPEALELIHEALGI